MPILTGLWIGSDDSTTTNELLSQNAALYRPFRVNKMMGLKEDLQAIIWDYDGTLVDTRHKNLNVTREIVESFGVDPNDYTALQSLENYEQANKSSRNWRELYRREFGFTDKQTDDAGGLWTDYQLEDDTPVPFYDGIQDVVLALQNFLQGIVSQNSKRDIARTLEAGELLPHFKSIVGYEEVHLRKQKPEPDGLLTCLERLTGFRPGYVLYIGDHETDVLCALNANLELQRNHSGVRVMSIGALYGSGNFVSDWSVKPDHKAESVEDIIDIVQTFH